MDIKKIRGNLFRFVIIPVGCFFYFLGLNEYGRTYRKNHPEKAIVHETAQQLNEGWKYHEGNNPQWATPQFNDSSWASVHSDSMPAWYKGQEGWFRLRFKVDSVLLKSSLSLVLNQKGASEIYFDGEKIADFGRVSSQESGEEIINPGALPLNVQLHNTAFHTIAIRYSNMHFKGSGATQDEFFPGIPVEN